MEKAKQEMASEIDRTRQELAELKAMLKSNNLSPMLSDKASCGQTNVNESKPLAAKHLEPLMVDTNDCVPISPIPPKNKVK